MRLSSVFGPHYLTSCLQYKNIKFSESCLSQRTHLEIYFKLEKAEDLYPAVSISASGDP